MRSEECLAASPILKIRALLLKAAAVCLFSNTPKAPKFISTEDNNLPSPVQEKLGHKRLSQSSFPEVSW